MEQVLDYVCVTLIARWLYYLGGYSEISLFRQHWLVGMFLRDRTDEVALS